MNNSSKKYYIENRAETYSEDLLKQLSEQAEEVEEYKKSIQQYSTWIDTLVDTNQLLQDTILSCDYTIDENIFYVKVYITKDRKDFDINNMFKNFIEYCLEDKEGLYFDIVYDSLIDRMENVGTRIKITRPATICYIIAGFENKDSFNSFCSNMLHYGSFIRTRSLQGILL